MYDFFISHSSEDKEKIVQPMVQHLKNMGYSVWYDEEKIYAGDAIVSDIKAGLNESYCLVLIITDSFVEKIWTIFETAFFDSLPQRALIPVIYEITPENYRKISDILNGRKNINGRNESMKEIACQLSQTLRQIKIDNKDLECLDRLKKVNKKIASNDVTGSTCISKKLNEYFYFIEGNYDMDFIVLSAQKIVIEIVCALMENNSHVVHPVDRNVRELSSLINEEDIGTIDFREYVMYVFSLPKETQTSQIKSINNALANIVEYYCHTKYPISSSSNIQVVYPEELKYNDFVEMYEIDKKVMREDLIASVETICEWYQYNPYTHIAVKDVCTQKIVGYFAMLPINEQTYNQIISGNFLDKDFNTDNIEQYIFSKFYRLYIAGVAIDPDYQNTSAFIKLYNALIDILLMLAKERGVYISEILAEASTKQGEKFCQMVGMTKVTSTDSGTDVYELVTIPPKFRLKNKKGMELFELCKRKYEEFRELCSE